VYRAFVAFVLVVLASQFGAPTGLAQKDDGAPPVVLPSEPTAPTAPSQSSGNLCAEGFVPIIDTLYFPNGAVAIPGCYPLATIRQLGLLGDHAAPDGVPIRCRPAYPGADIRDDVLTNVNACTFPEGVALAFTGDPQRVIAVQSALSDIIASSILAGYIEASGNTPAGANPYSNLDSGGDPAVPPDIAARISLPASAYCRDGWVSHSATASGSCSQHGGVSVWGPNAPQGHYNGEPGTLWDSGHPYGAASTGGAGSGGCGSRGGPGGPRSASGRCPSRP
jgi:hypothetical protein